MKNAGKAWHDNAINYVDDKWGELPLKSIARRVGKSEYAVLRYAEKHSFGSMYRGSYLTTWQIADMFKIDPSTVIYYWIEKYELKATDRALMKRNIIRVKLDDLYDWCYGNQDKWRASYLPEYALGCEPEWLKEKRIKDSDPIIAKSGTAWSYKELTRVHDGIDKGMTCKEIATMLPDRTYLAVKRKFEQRKRELKKLEQAAV